jgi:glycosyltransferase EpsJ
LKTISVIIPAYNAELFIKNCIKTILAQTFQDFEIVAVNDGSTDKTLDILREFEAKDDRITVISQENGGVSAARNTALAAATGKYVVYVDADDTIPPDAFEILLSHMDDDVDLVVGSFNIVRIMAEPVLATPAVYTAEQIYENFIEFDKVVWMPVCKLFRRDIIADNNITYDTSVTFGEDHIFNLEYARYIRGKVIVTDEIVYNYHHIRGGLCAKYYPNMHDFQRAIYNRMEQYFGGRENMPYEYKKYYLNSHIKYCIEYYIIWQPFGKAVDRIEECFASYSDLLDDALIRELFGDESYDMIKKGDFSGFAKYYIKKNPEKTLWKKLRRNVRKFLEMLQRVFLKRA